MKNTKTCPKCQSANIVRFDGRCGPYGVGDYFYASALKTVMVHRYVCCGCGYTEQWIDEKDIVTAANGRYAKR